MAKDLKPKNDTFDFIINEDNEVLLLLYVREGDPKDPAFYIDYNTNKGTLRPLHNPHFP